MAEKRWGGGNVRRYLLVLAGLLLVVGALAIVKYAQIASLIAMGEEMERSGPPPETVSTAIAEAQRWERSVEAVGTVASVESVTIRNEVPGVVKRIRFRSGDRVERGEVLVELDASTERSELDAARARLHLARVTVERTRILVEQQAFSRARLDNDEAELRMAAGEVAALEAQLQKKIVRAPFAGRLGIRQVDAGAYLEVGTAITVLDAVGEVFVDFPLPQEELARVEAGAPVRLRIRGSGTIEAKGTVVAVEPTVDVATRNAELRAHVPDPDDRLRTGMFANVSVLLPGEADVVAVPATAIVHASYGDSVFVIEEREPGAPGMAETPDGRPVKVARQQFVRVGAARGDFVAVEKGLVAGQEVVVAGAFKLRNGVPVVIDDSVELNPSLDPRPENR